MMSPECPPWDALMTFICARSFGGGLDVLGAGIALVHVEAIILHRERSIPALREERVNARRVGLQQLNVADRPQPGDDVLGTLQSLELHALDVDLKQVQT